MQCCSNIYLPVAFSVKNLTTVLERFSSIGHSFAVLLNCTDGQQYLRLSKVYLKRKNPTVLNDISLTYSNLQCCAKYEHS